MAPADSAAFTRQGRTTHFTTFYSGELPYREPGGLVLLKTNTGWPSSWSIIVPGRFSSTRSFDDLLVYDRAAGVGEFYATEGGNIELVRSTAGWRDSWSIIVSIRLSSHSPHGQSGANRPTELLFYDPSAGVGEMYGTHDDGTLSLIATHYGWLGTWSKIVPCTLTGAAGTDLLFYDADAGVVEMCHVDLSGELHPIATHENWRRTWSVVAACKLTGGPYSDLLFYDRQAGVGEMYTIGGHGALVPLATHMDWRPSWSIVEPCKVGDGPFSDLLFYDQGAGVGEFYETTGEGGISLLYGADYWRKSWSIIARGNFTDGAGDDFLFYDPSGGTGEIYASRGNAVAAAVLSTCEPDYRALVGYFDGVTPEGLPFQVYVRPGDGGATHANCGNTQVYCDTRAPFPADKVRFEVVAEAAEVFMDNQDKEWDCGASNGEGLSRVLATHRYPNELSELQGGFLAGSATGPPWLKSNRPDFVSDTDGTDKNNVATGCATLFINYLKFQLGFSLEQITQAGGDELQRTFEILTGRGDAFLPFRALLDRRFAAGTSDSLMTDNPFPIHRDLLFYDPSAGTGEFYTSNVDGAISRLRTDLGWRDSWSLIVPGSFSRSSFHDLFFYDRCAGVGEFYWSDGHGKITLLNSYDGWRPSWDLIASGRFGGGNLDGLLFYDRAGGTGELYTSAGHGVVEHLATHTYWRPSWTTILVGSFTRNAYPDLLFYDASAGLIEICSTDAGGGISLVGRTENLPPSWAVGLACNITGGQFADVMFYDPSAGVAQFFATDGLGSLRLSGTHDIGDNWSEIHATGFGEFLFYDASAGVGEYRRALAQGFMTLLKRYDDWRHSWSLIAPGTYS